MFLLLSLTLLQDGPAGLEASISFKADGPLPDALRSIEQQTGLAFAFLPELFPEGRLLRETSFKGGARDGLDALAAALDARWEIGEAGSVVLTPRGAAPAAFAPWRDREFENETGVEILDASEHGQRVGLLPGDLIVGLNGERLATGKEFLQASRELPRDATATFTVRRGADLIQLKILLAEPGNWSKAVGAARWADAPSPWTQYQKAGHRSPAWDKHIRYLTEECRREAQSRQIGGVFGNARAAVKAGCRDPKLLELAGTNTIEFSPALAREMETWTDPARLRGTYGGTFVLSRVWLASLFLQQGGAATRDASRRTVEAGWALMRDGPQWGLRRDAGYALANLHFLEGRFEACARLMKSIQDQYLSDPHTWQVKLHTQALCRLGRFDEALREHELYSGRNPDSYTRGYAGLVAAARDGLAAAPPDRFAGPAGIVRWKTLTALDALAAAEAGKRVTGFRAPDDMRGNFWTLQAMEPDPFFEDLELHFFPRIEEGYSKSAKLGPVFGSQPRPPRAGATARDYNLHTGVQYMLLDDLKLTRYHKGIGHSTSIPLPGFANDGGDVLRMFKAGSALTVRSNGSWIATDVSPALAQKGACLLLIEALRAGVETGILIPTNRCYDNDRIRELLERVSSPHETLTADERLRLYDEATVLAPPQGRFRQLRAKAPATLLGRVPAPAYPEDAPPLEPMTVDEAQARLGRRALVWSLPDPVDTDAVWCARPDGTIEVLSRVRYWTTFHRHIREYLGADTAVGNPHFDKEAVWFPTPRGLFRFDRKEETFRRVPVAGLFPGPAIRSITEIPDGMAMDTTAGAWVHVARTGAWRR